MWIEIAIHHLYHPAIASRPNSGGTPTTQTSRHTNGIKKTFSTAQRQILLLIQHINPTTTFASTTLLRL